MAKRICQGSPEWEDVAHFAISEFMQHERGQELVDAGRGMQFLSGIMWRSFNSSTSQYHTLYRQKGRACDIKEAYLEQEDDVYDWHQDAVVEAIKGIMEDMHAEKSEIWYRVVLFQKSLDEPNISELSRQTGISRNSINNAIESAKRFIKQQLKNQNINYD